MNQNVLHQKWLMGGGKRLLRLLYQTTSLKTFTPLTNLGYFMKFLPNKTYQRKPEKISGG